jgi:hypothetical protein
MKKLLLAVLALAISGTMAMADVPDPSKCQVSPCDALNGMIACPRIPSPLDESIATATVKNSSDAPINAASVVVLLTATNPACPNAVLTGITNSSGVVTITVAASGCTDGVPSAGVWKANGVTIRQYVNVKSPDYDGASGNGQVNLSDLVNFSGQFNGLLPAICHDYNNDGDCGLEDLVVFGKAFSGAKKCS